MWKQSVFAIVILFMCISETTSQGTMGISIQKAIDKAVQDYNAGEYKKAIDSFETALVHYRMLKHIDTNCGLRCGSPDIQKEIGMDMSGFDDLLNYGNLLAQAKCVKICREEHKFSASNIERPSPGYVVDFEKRVPYNYLQFAYYKAGRIKDACKAAHTFFQVNPYDEQMRENLEFYKGLDEVDEDYFVDLEEKPFVGDFVKGAKAYEDENFSQAIDYIEKALLNYFKAHEECKTLCYVWKAPNSFHRLHQAIAAKYMPAINCSLQCDDKLKPLVGDSFLENFVSRCFSYLQFSYYQMDKWSMAVPAAASVLLLDPADEVARSNFMYYTENGESHGLVPEVHYQPRSDARKYHIENTSEKDIYDLILKTLDYGDEVELEDEEEQEEGSRGSIKKELIEEITKQITVTLGERLRGDIG